MKVDINKKYKTRDGRSVTIFQVSDHEIDYPVFGVIDGNSEVWTREGEYGDITESCNDLVEVPEEIQLKGFLNVYETYVAWNETRELADANAMRDRIACIEITNIKIKKGEGL